MHVFISFHIPLAIHVGGAYLSLDDAAANEVHQAAHSTDALFDGILDGLVGVEGVDFSTQEAIASITLTHTHSNITRQTKPSN